MVCLLVDIGTDNPYYDEPSALRLWKRGSLSLYLDGFARQLYKYGLYPYYSMTFDYVSCHCEACKAGRGNLGLAKG